MATIYGDPSLLPAISGHQKAKAQILNGVDDQDNVLIGDVDLISDHAKGGSDELWSIV